MRVRHRADAQVFRTIVFASPLCVADEESLLRREAVAHRLLRFLRHRGHLGLPCHPAQDQAAQVGDVLAQRELAVDLDVVDDRVLRVLVDDALRALFERLRILLRPPVLQVTVGVELAALVVERVRQFVADGAARVAVVRSVVHLRVEQRRLQHAGREVDVVHLRIEVRVHRRRRHAPLGAVQRLADLGQLAAHFELVAALDVAGEVAGLHVVGAVVAPLVRVADLVDDGGQFLLRLLLGLGAHPVEFVDVLLHRVFDLARHVQRFLLQLGRERAADEFLAQRFAQLVVDQGHAALPARLLLLHAAQGLAEEVEVFVVEPRRQHRRHVAPHLPAQVGARGGHVVRLQHLAERLEERRFRHVESGQVALPRLVQVGMPVEARRQGLQAFRIDLVEQLVGIALLHGRQRRLRERRLHLHHARGVALRDVGRVAQQLERVGDVGDVFGTHILRFRIRLEVGVAVRQAEAAGDRERDHARRIGKVLARRKAEEQARIGQRHLQARQHARQVAVRAQRGDLVEVRRQRRGAACLDGFLVHAGAEVVADLLLAGVAAVGAFGQVFEDAPQVAAVVQRQLAVDGPARLVGRDRVVLHPAAAGVLVEVDAGIGVAVHRVHVQAGRVREFGGGTLGGRRGGGSGVLGTGERSEAGKGQEKCETDWAHAVFRNWQNIKNRILPYKPHPGNICMPMLPHRTNGMSHSPKTKALFALNVESFWHRCGPTDDPNR